MINHEQGAGEISLRNLAKESGADRDVEDWYIDCMRCGLDPQQLAFGLSEQFFPDELINLCGLMCPQPICEKLRRSLIGQHVE